MIWFPNVTELRTWGDPQPTTSLQKPTKLRVTPPVHKSPSSSNSPQVFFLLFCFLGVSRARTSIVCRYLVASVFFFGGCSQRFFFVGWQKWDLKKKTNTQRTKDRLKPFQESLGPVEVKNQWFHHVFFGRKDQKGIFCVGKEVKDFYIAMEKNVFFLQ